jgi:hypothetical protein
MTAAYAPFTLGRRHYLYVASSLYSPVAVAPVVDLRRDSAQPFRGTAISGEEVEKVFEEIRDRHGHPDVASYYRGIAQWPGFLEATWERVGAVVNTVAYEERKREVLEAARGAVLELPLPGKREVLEKGVVDEEQVGELRAILAVFHFRLNADMLLIKALLDGPEAARSSRFSFTG